MMNLAMPFVRKTSYFYFIALLYLSAYSAQVSARSAFNIVIGLNKPPYVLAETPNATNEQRWTGFEVELLELVFKQLKVQPRFIFMADGRLPSVLSLPHVDAIMTVNEQLFDRQYLTAPYINYQNVAVSFKPSVERIADLNHHKVASFYRADQVLGNRYAEAVKSSLAYKEYLDQQEQVNGFYAGLHDVLIIDINIFNYYQQTASASFNAINVHTQPIFPLSEYRLALKNPALISDFNRALRQVKYSDAYQALKIKYAIQAN
ncbi:substrate-binding periplasmic protein [Algibacillus agarilyticus]|uniref:substrate-binding periplasmic protein n=1 Tax=Algibacillus agarilyticus TaxID=2234133 RepID=UPI000DD0DEAB|nr:transporter substrate-binding domain-containing protein [Algibacillus agarilyticus]